MNAALQGGVAVKGQAAAGSNEKQVKQGVAGSKVGRKWATLRHRRGGGRSAMFKHAVAYRTWRADLPFIAEVTRRRWVDDQAWDWGDPGAGDGGLHQFGVETFGCEG